VPRYQVSGIPAQLADGEALGLSAFMPHFNRLAASGAQAYKGGVTGRPGTAGIPVEPHVMLPGGDGLNDLALVGVSRSGDAPSAFWPNLYYDNPAMVGGDGDRYYPGAGCPVQIYNPVRPQDTTMIPVPATDLRGVYQAHAAKLAGGIQSGGASKRALNQKAAIVRWAQRRAGNGSGQ